MERPQKCDYSRAPQHSWTSCFHTSPAIVQWLEVTAFCTFFLLHHLLFSYRKLPPWLSSVISDVYFIGCLRPWLRSLHSFWCPVRQSVLSWVGAGRKDEGGSLPAAGSWSLRFRTWDRRIHLPCSVPGCAGAWVHSQSESSREDISDVRVQL